MTVNIRKLNPQNPQDQQRLAQLEKQPGPDRLYLVSQPKADAKTPEDILDPQSSAKATWSHLIQLINDRRITTLHCDPQPDRVWVRGRIDGHLQTIGSLMALNYGELIGYLKIQANLDLTDDVCQAGVINWKNKRQNRQGWLQTTPTVNGEKLTISLETNSAELDLKNLGFWGLTRRQLQQALGQTRGLILFVSPQPSARHQCLEASESLLLQNDNLSLASLTDQPRLNHNHQTLLNPRWGRTQQNWLKSQVKDNNDILVIDQLLDSPSCQLAVEAALNNKLVLSSLPVVDSGSAIDFLTQAGVDPHLLVAARPTIIPIRLARKLKPQPKPQKQASASDWLTSPIWSQFGIKDPQATVKKLLDQAAQAATEIGGHISQPTTKPPQDSDYYGQILLTNSDGLEELTDPDQINNSKNQPGDKNSLINDGLIKICLGLTSAVEVELAIGGQRYLS